MKKFISLFLCIIITVSFAYAHNTSSYSQPAVIADTGKPTGGIATETETEEYDSSFIELNEVTELTGFDKYLYDALYNQEAIIDVYSYKIPLSGFGDWFLEFAFSYPELMLVDNGFSYTRKNGYLSTITPNYYVSKSKRETFISVMNQKLEEYRELVKNEPDELKKYLLIYSKMIRECHYAYDYDVNKYCHTAYSFFVNGSATCQGYSSALKIIGDSLGFEVSCCYNRTAEVGHIWNYIKLNGNWYHTDVTWGDYSKLLEDGTYDNTNDQGAVYANILCSDETYAANGHGSKSDYKTFEDELPSCTDKTYESDKWAFNLKTDAGFYLLDFEYKGPNLLFDLVGAKDSNGNPIKFVTNNLWGNDTYISEPVMGSASAMYYIFPKKDIPSAKIRLTLKSEEKIKSIVSGDIANKNGFKVFAAYIPLDEESLSSADEISSHLWIGTKPLAEKVTVNK